MELSEAASLLDNFAGGRLGGRLAELERLVSGTNAEGFPHLLDSNQINSAVLDAALTVKAMAGQINVTVHAMGILLTLPRILEEGEVVEYVSLGAGNTGRAFDLETDRRIAEFKFISWRGGSEAIRQNQLFKDFYLLAESGSPKRKELYVTGIEHPSRFLSGGRALASILSRNNKLWTGFQARYANTFTVVRDYYAHRAEEVALIDLIELCPDLFGNGGLLAAAEVDITEPE